MVTHWLGTIEKVCNIDEHRLKIVRNRVLIAICRLTGNDKRQSNTLFLAIFDPSSSIVTNVFGFPFTSVNKHQKLRIRLILIVVFSAEKNRCCKRTICDLALILGLLQQDAGPLLLHDGGPAKG